MRRILRSLLALCLALALFGSALGESPASLQQGDSGQAVRQMQQRLIELGLLKGKADGLYGPKTLEAVKALQQHLIDRGHALSLSGQADEATIRLLYDDFALQDLLNLKPGDKGARVSQLQARLYDMRLLDTLPDGDYGPKTTEAVLAFQRILQRADVPGTQLSGVADHLTRGWLESDLRPLDLRLPQTFDDAYPLDLHAEDLYAKAAMLVDLDTGAVLLHKNAAERLYPASTTKIMTLLLALEKLPLDRMIIIPEAAAQVPKDSSLVPVSPGEEMTAQDLLYGLMLRSGNDAANAVAVLCAGSVEQFVSAMNARAEALGLTNTHFTNPHGYHDAKHYSSAEDLARLSAHALRQGAFRQIVSQNAYTLAQTKRRGPLDIKVSTELFNPLSAFYYPGAFGIKSGYTRAAGVCYVGCATRDGRTLLAVILSCRIRDQAWTDMHRLFNLGFASKT